MNPHIAKHCIEIDRCNQRGGRMLSIVDLIDAGTVSIELAAYCLAAIGNGASFLVGAMPGGAGKTTVMGALLNFVPADVVLRPADGIESIRRGLAEAEPRSCYICHEIGSGPYYAYLWGEELRAYFELPSSGHLLATNLHADTYEQAHRQICSDNAVAPSALRRMSLMLFLTVGHSGFRTHREISTVWESDGLDEHQLVFTANGEEPRLTESMLVTHGEFADARTRIEQIMNSDARTIEQVRSALVD
ncbi:MAG: hypothetical protein H8E44_28800 [Planctomycetes bacterium]|nr:hypothetical protein [Planctomycetota bacterium]MBL7038571.1 hypothetical protein [Pirellulaceae bacterium]